MHILEEHWTPDGLLKFVVGREEDGDVYLGFLGVGWHTHGDILALSSGLSEGLAVKQFVDDLLNSRMIIEVTRVAGSIRYVDVTDRPTEYEKDRQSDESIEFRYWDGTLVV
jgi:hypothetical protein